MSTITDMAKDPPFGEEEDTMRFYPVDDLRSESIFLRLDRTCEAQPEKDWVPAYYFSICLSDGTKIGTCDLSILYFIAILFMSSRSPSIFLNFLLGNARLRIENVGK